MRRSSRCRADPSIIARGAQPCGARDADDAGHIRALQAGAWHAPPPSARRVFERSSGARNIRRDGGGWAYFLMNLKSVLVYGNDLRRRTTHERGFHGLQRSPAFLHSPPRGLLPAAGWSSLGRRTS